MSAIVMAIYTYDGYQKGQLYYFWELVSRRDSPTKFKISLVVNIISVAALVTFSLLAFLDLMK